MTEHFLITLAGVGLLAMLCQWLAWLTRIPAILPLLLSGIIVGPVFGWLDPDQLLGHLLFPFVSICVAIILFEGSLTLRFKDLHGLTAPVRNLVSIGTLITWVLVSLSAHYIAGIAVDMALLFGAIAVVTGPTVIMPLLRSVRPNRNITHILRWEGIIIDPIGALLAVIVFEFIITSHNDAGDIPRVFGSILLAGITFGMLTGVIVEQVLQRRWVPEYLRAFFVLTIVIISYAGANYLAEEAGLLAVTVMGITLTNRLSADALEDIATFKEHISLLLLSVLFIILASRIDFAAFRVSGWWPPLILALLTIPIRTVAVLSSTVGSTLTWNERALLCWVAPRGIVAAAISAAFALRLEKINHPDADLLVPLVLSLIIVTVVLQGLSTASLAARLKVTEPAPDGTLILGANLVARKIAGALRKQNIAVLLGDNSWDSIRIARMEGLPVYYGNILSEHAMDNLDINGLGYLLALSGRSHLNTLASIYYKREFGMDRVYELPTRPSASPQETDKYSVADNHKGRTLFSKNASFDLLAKRLRAGVEIHATSLSESFDLAACRSKHGEHSLPLFAIDPKKKLHLFTADHSPETGPGWTVLILPENGHSPPMTPAANAGKIKNS